MEFKKCFQCKKELPIKVGSDPALCPYCGARNEGLEPKRANSNRKAKRKNLRSKSSVDDFFDIF